jgi:hypothetical protein
MLQADQAAPDPASDQESTDRRCSGRVLSSGIAFGEQGPWFYQAWEGSAAESIGRSNRIKPGGQWLACFDNPEQVPVASRTGSTPAVAMEQGKPLLLKSHSFSHFRVSM